MKLAIAAIALILPASASQNPQPPRDRPDATAGSRMPNVYDSGGANCLPVVRQIDAEKRRLRGSDGHTLDREPMAFGFLAVDRRVGGCREVTFLRGSPAASETARR